MFPLLAPDIHRSALALWLVIPLYAGGPAHPADPCPRPCPAATVPHADPAPDPERVEPQVPAWFLEHLDSHMVGGGRWVADNQAYLSDSEPIGAYGIQWDWGAGRKSLRGRMFALAGGRETETIWDLRILWHPTEQRAQVFQYGSDGTLAEGLLQPEPDGRTRLELKFHAPDGSTRTVRHLEGLESDGARVSSSFVRTPKGWAPRRTYVWLPHPE